MTDSNDNATNPEDAPRFSLGDLMYLMARLRDPESGCPWDIKQTFKSIAPSTIEEAYEVVDAIERDDSQHLQEELGDLLFQVVFYSQMAKESGEFTLQEIVSGLTEKLLRRHPHVFPAGDLYGTVTDSQRLENEKQVKAKWEEIKRAERNKKGKTGLLDDVPIGLPALTRASKLQKRAAQIGFDWPNAEQVVEKILEEVSELKTALAAGDIDQQHEELGDVLFSVVNLSRHLKYDSETALRMANNKFSTRFRYIEQAFEAQSKPLSPEYREEMEALWEEAKAK